MAAVSRRRRRRGRLRTQRRLSGFSLSGLGFYDGNAAVGQVQITGPHDATGPGDTPSRRRLFPCRPARPADEESCARQILAGLARRAYRRPVIDDEVDTLMIFYTHGRIESGFEAGIQKALERLLVAPEFLFRIEREPPDVAPGAPYRLTDLELASRLSFFLWSSIPMRSCCRSPRLVGSTHRPSWSGRCGGCWPTRARRRSSTTLRASGCSCVGCAG